MDNNITQLQLLRGDSSSNDAYTGRPGELTVNTTDWSIRVHDGVTVGGYVIAGGGGSVPSSSYAESSSVALTASYALNVKDVFPYTGSAIVSGSLTVTGSINAPRLTGSLLGTSSWAQSASVAISSSYSISSSFTISALSSSFARTASFTTSASYALSSSFTTSGSYALSSSFATSASRASSSATIDVLSGGSTTGLGIYSGSFFGTASSAVTASFALNATPGFPFSGSAVITGSLLVSSSGITLIGRGLTGSVFGTSSWAQSSSIAISSSFATSASYSLSSSFAVSASRASSSAVIDVLSGGSTTGLGIYSGSFSGSFFGTLSGSGGGSGVGFPFSGSAVITGSLLVSSSGITLIGAGLTGSVSGSLIGTASYAQNSNLLDGLDSTVFATTGSNSFTGIQSINNNTNSTTWTNGALIVSGGVGIGRDVNISGSLNVRGVLTVATMSTQYITSSQLNVGTSKITLNDDDNVRFAGISIFDSGSTAATASIYWDSLNHKFIYENISGEPYTSGMFIAGPVNTGTLGNELGLTVGRIPVASGTDHIDSRTASSSIRVDFPSRLTHIEAGLNVTGSVSASSYSSSISNAVGFLGTASWAVSASRASSSAVVDVLSGGSTTGLGIYSGSFSGSFFGILSGSGGGGGVGFPFSGSAVITGSLLISGSGLTLVGGGLTGSVSGSLTGTASFATSASFAPVGPGTSQSIALFNTSNTLSSSVIFQSGGNIGIGTTEPSRKLTVNGGATISGSSTIIGSLTVGQNSNSSTTARIDLTAGGNGFDSLIDFGYYDTFDANIWNVGRKGSTGAFFISNQGSGAEINAITIAYATNNVGIGISSSINNKLQIQGNVSASSYTSSISNAVGFLGTASWAQSASIISNPLTFSNTGNGAVTGTTYNGSVARTISYNSVGAIQGTQTSYSAITSGSSGDWFPLFTMSEVTNGPVYCSINTYAHSSVSFVAVDGYGPSNLNHIVILGSVWNANNTFANISGVRITDAGIVQVRLTWTTGPTVDIDVALTCAGTPPALSANLSVDNSGTINDSVDLTTLNGYIRTENGYYGGTNLVLNANGASYLNGGNVGIGTTSPSALLHISASGTTNDLLIGSTGSPKLFVSASGNIGINTLSPTERLRVNGTFASNAIWTTAAAVTNWGSYSTAYGTLTWDVGYARIHATAGNRLDLGANGNNPHITITGSGDVGIGITSSFSNKLHVQGNVSASSYTSSISNAVGFFGTASFAISASRASSSATVDVISGGSTTGLGIYSGSFFGTASFANTASFALNSGGGVGFPFSGNAIITGSLLVSGSGITLVGAGLTGSISGSLVGTASFATSASFAPVGPGTSQSIALFNTSNTLSSSVIFQSGSKIGIGTVNPIQTLDIVGVLSSNNLTFKTTTPTKAGGIEFRRGGTAAELSGSLATIEGWDEFSGGGYQGSLRFFTLNNNISVERVRITETGNVGIGTGSPSASLHVQGNISASSYTSSISNAVGFLGTASWAQSASRATSVAPNSVALGTDTTGNYVASVAQGRGITVTGTSGEGATHTVTLGSSSAGYNISGSGNWFTVARRTNASTGRGISEVYIHGTGGDVTPSVLKILWNVDWGGNGTIRIDSYTGNLPISNIRSTYTGSTGVSELEIQSTTSTNATIYSTVTDYSTAGGTTTPVVTASINLPTTTTIPIGYFYDGVIFSSASTNVGIGTTVPGQKLTVIDTLSVTNTTGEQRLLIGNQDSTGANNPAIIRAANGSLSFGGGTSWSGNGGTFTSTMRVSDEGDVGIGTTVNHDGARLDVRSGKIVAGTSGSTNGSVTLQNYYTDGALALWGSMFSHGGPYMGYAVKPSASIGGFLSATSIGASRGAYEINGTTHTWYTGSNQTVAINNPVVMTPMMTLNGTGLGIGTVTNPTQRLDVDGYGRFTSGIVGASGLTVYGDNSSTSGLVLTTGGNLGVGTTNPGDNRLHVQGNISASSYTSSISNAVGFVGTASFAVSASRASSSAVVDVLSGGSTTGLGIYSGSFSGSFFGNMSSGVGFPYVGNAIITGSLIVSSSGITLLGSGLTGSVFGTSSWASSSSIATTASFATSVGILGAVTASSIVVTSSFGQLFTSSSASVSSGISRSFTDTGLFANQIGNHAVYEMYLAWDPNVQGSPDYRHVVIGDIIVMTNWNGTVVTSYIGYNERYALSSGSIGVQTGSVDVLWVSSSGEERRDCPVRSSTNQIRIKYDGFTLNRPEQNLRLTRKL